jgi:molybdopterin/thiamine biosynthesis adenylyltransferase
MDDRDRAVLQARVREEAQHENDVAVLPLNRERALAGEAGCSPREVELAALEAGVCPRRYLRNLGTLGLAGQARLLRSTVAVIGLGGLGGYVAEALARMGVGRLVLVDGDVFEDHNLNRQLLSSEANLGCAKIEVARRRVAEINAAVEVVAWAAVLDRDNAAQLLHGAEVVVDCLDKLPTRFVLQSAAQALGVPMVHGSIAGYLGQVMTIFPGDPGLCALYGDGEIPERGVEVELGNPAATPMMIAAWQVQEVIKLLLPCGEPLRRRLLIMDAESGTAMVMEM